MNLLLDFGRRLCAAPATILECNFEAMISDELRTSHAGTSMQFARIKITKQLLTAVCATKGYSHNWGRDKIGVVTSVHSGPGPGRKIRALPHPAMNGAPDGARVGTLILRPRRCAATGPRPFFRCPEF